MRPILASIAILSYTVFFTSCAKEENINNAPEDTVVGGLLSARINQAIWVANVGQITMSQDSTEMTIHGERSPYSNKLTDMTLHIAGYTGPGSYKIGGGAGSAIYYDNVTPYSADSGTVIITAEENVNDTVYVKGSFNFFATNMDGYHLTITAGQFRMRNF